MTREEAIDMIKYDMRLHHNYMSGEYRKALRMAISALQQPEIIRCKDCKYNATSKKCLNPDSFFLVPADDDYCSLAERREE